VHRKLPVNIIVGKNIVVRDAVSAADDQTGVSFESQFGNLTIEPNTAITSRSELTFKTHAATSTLNVGANTTVYARTNDHGGVNFTSLGALNIGANQVWTASGGYTDLFVSGKTLTIAPGQTFTGPNHGSLEIHSESNLALTNFYWRAGYVIVWVHNGHDLAVRDSYLIQTYKNGNLKLYADGGKITIDRSMVTAHPDAGSIVNPQGDCDTETIVSDDGFCLEKKHAPTP
jgi:hypothetical protein